MICSTCGAENDPGDILCEQCGERLETGLSIEPDTETRRFVLVPASGALPIALEERMVVGRMNTCDVSVPDKSVSREHARLSRLAGGYLLEDLQSTNGTLVNGYRITEATVVRPGDSLTFGTVEFRMAGPEEEPAVAEDRTGVETSPDVSTPARTYVATATAPDEPRAPASTQAASVPAEQPVAPESSELLPVTPPADGQEAGRLADEVVATAAHLSDLAQRLATTSISRDADVSSAPGAAPDLAAIRDVVASVPAPPMTDDELAEAREILEGLADNPKDLDLLMRVRDMAPQLYRVVQQYGQLEHVLTAVEEAAERSSAS